MNLRRSKRACTLKKRAPQPTCRDCLGHCTSIAMCHKNRWEYLKKQGAAKAKKAAHQPKRARTTSKHQSPVACSLQSVGVQKPHKSKKSVSSIDQHVYDIANVSSPPIPKEENKNISSSARPAPNASGKHFDQDVANISSVHIPKEKNNNISSDMPKPPSLALANANVAELSNANLLHINYPICPATCKLWLALGMIDSILGTFARVHTVLL